MKGKFFYIFAILKMMSQIDVSLLNFGNNLNAWTLWYIVLVLYLKVNLSCPFCVRLRCLFLVKLRGIQNVGFSH